MKSLLATATAIIAGLLVLAGYFLPLPALDSTRGKLLDWAIVLSAVAMLVGIVNLVGTHLRKITQRKHKDLYSIFLLIAFVITFILGLILSPADQGFQHVVTSIQIPIETSLLALLTIILLFASLFIIKNKKGYFVVVFFISILVFLTIQLVFTNPSAHSQALNNIIQLISKIPMAGARGILLGIAIGSLATGLRVLLGADRPYRG